MTREDILRMLDLKEKPSNTTTHDPIEVEHDEHLDCHELSDTVLAVDGWDFAQGERIKDNVNDPILTDEAAADFFAVYFHQQPELLGLCVDPRRQQMIEQLMESSEYQTLHMSTMSNYMASEMAATALANQYCAMKQNDKNCSKPHTKEEQEIQCLRAIGKALKAATEEVEELEGIESALGLDSSKAQGGSVEQKRLAEMFKAVRNNPRLRRICELAGRYRRAAQAKQRTKMNHGYDDMIGVEMDGDVSRLLPVELAKLADEDLELDAMRRLVERQSMCRQFRGVDKQAKGPIVVCVDESGSMDGEPICCAKAFALAMAWVARHQGRWCGLVSYSDAHSGKFLALPPGKWDEAELCDWLAHFFNGGTDMDVPLDVLPNQYWKMMDAPSGKTDIIIITDGKLRVPEPMQAKFNAWKSTEKARAISIVLNAEAGDLNKVSDETYLVRSLGLDEDAINKCFSV